jgi:hypothetical protein
MSSLPNPGLTNPDAEHSDDPVQIYNAESTTRQTGQPKDIIPNNHNDHNDHNGHIVQPTYNCDSIISFNRDVQPVGHPFENNTPTESITHLDSIDSNNCKSCTYFNNFGWSFENIKFLTILSYIVISYIIFFTVYGAYEFTYNFNVTFGKFDNYKNAYLAMYTLYIIILVNILIIIQLYIRKLYNGSRGKCMDVFICILIFPSSLYLASFLMSLAFSTVKSCETSNNLLLCGPLDMIVFTISLYVSLLGSIMLYGLIRCFVNLCKWSINTCREDGLA